MYTYYYFDLVTMRGMSTNYDMELLMMTGMSTQVLTKSRRGKEVGGNRGKARKFE